MAGRLTKHDNTWINLEHVTHVEVTLEKNQRPARVVLHFIGGGTASFDGEAAKKFIGWLEHQAIGDLRPRGAP